MKKFLFIVLPFLSFLASAQVITKKKQIHNTNKVKELPDSVVVDETNSYQDKVDRNMKGPKGETVFIGTNGNRYYLKGNQKRYVSNALLKKKTP